MTDNNVRPFDSLFENLSFVRQPSTFRPAAIERLKTKLTTAQVITSGNDYDEVQRRQTVNDLQTALAQEKRAITQTKPTYVPPSALTDTVPNRHMSQK